MLKKITALKARQNLGQIMNEVAIKEDDYIVERAGKPLVAVISIEKYKQLEEKRNEFFKWVDKVRERTQNVAPLEIENAIAEAGVAVKKSENETEK